MEQIIKASTERIEMIGVGLVEGLEKKVYIPLEKGYVPVACRLCGETRLYPEKMAEQFDADNAFECNNCIKKINSR